MNNDINLQLPESELIKEHDGSYVAHYDPATGNPSEIIVFSLASLARTEPEELRPLHENIDTEALDDLFAPTNGGRPRVSGIVTFNYNGYSITVDHDGAIRFRSIIDAGTVSGVGSPAETE